MDSSTTALDEIECAKFLAIVKNTAAIASKSDHVNCMEDARSSRQIHCSMYRAAQPKYAALALKGQRHQVFKARKA